MFNQPIRILSLVSALLCYTNAAYSVTTVSPEILDQKVASISLARQLKVGDVVFIRIPKAPFTKVADTTSSWTNHVGIVSEVAGEEVMIAESRVPVSTETTWTKFVGRSAAGRVAITRLPTILNAQQEQTLKHAIHKRNGIWYDTGFDLHSKNRQFCSRYVREILQEMTGVEFGEVESFATLLKNNPQADEPFWRTWYFGKIPWQRQTITPASLLRDGRMRLIFDGQVE